MLRKKPPLRFRTRQTQLHRPSGHRQKEGILQAINYAALRFLHEPDWESSIQEVLQRLSEATGIQRIALRQVLYRQENQIVLTLRYAFDRRGEQGGPPLGSQISLSQEVIDSYTLSAAQAASSGQAIPLTSSDMPEYMRQMMQAFQFRKTLVAPLIIQGELWGLLLYNEPNSRPSWTISELEALQAAAGLIAAAIERQEARRRLEILVNSVPSILWEYDLLDQTYQFVSQQAQKILGYPDQAWMEGRSFWEARIHPDDRQRVVDYSDENIQAGRDFEQEYRMLAAGGRIVWFHNSVTIKNEGAIPRWLRGVKVDITRIKRAEEALREERNQAQRYLDTASVLLLALDPQGDILMINHWGCSLIGYSEAEVLGKNWFTNFVPIEERQQLQDYFKFVTSVEGQGVGSREHINSVIVRSGERRILSWINDFIYDKNQKFIGVLSSANDITESRQAEQALRSSEANLERAQSIAHVGSYSRNLDTHQVQWSKELRKIAACNDQEPSFELYLSRIHPQDLAGVLRAVEHTIHERCPLEVEYRILLPDGRLRYVYDQAEVAFDEAGKPVSIFGTIQDITDFKLTEIILEEHVQEIARLNEITQTALQSETSGDRLSLVAQKLRELVGAEFCYITLLDESGTHIRQAAAAGRDEDSYAPTLIASQRTVLEHAVLDLGEPLIIENTAGSELLDPTLLAQFPATCLMVLPLQSGGSQSTGTDPGYIPGEPSTNEGPASTTSARRDFGAAILGYNSLPTFTSDEIRRGERAARQVSLALAKDDLLAQARRAAGEMQVLVQVSAAMRKASTRQEIPPAIHEQICALFQTWGAVLISPLGGDRLWVEAAYGGWEKYAGRTFELEEASQPFLDFLRTDPLTIDDAAPFIHRFLPNEETTGYRALAVASLVTETGDQLGLLVISRNEVFSPTEMRLFTAIADICASALHRAALHRSLEEQIAHLNQAQSMLVQSEKLAALGGLVAGIAHELNNPLASIVLNAQLLQQRQQPEALDRGLEKIQLDAHRASKIVRGLLEFSRQRQPERGPVQVNDVIRDTLQFVNYEINTHNIQVETDLDPQLPIIQADPYQLQQVLLNLLNNAWQSIGPQRPGRLFIQTSSGAPALTEPGAQPTPVVKVRVQDNGPGIPSELLSRIFDPFFTTKTSGQGTGLGLSICHGIISEHDGRIWAESPPGEGAAFTFEIPTGSPAAPAAGARQARQVQPMNGQSQQLFPTQELPSQDRRIHTILVIDDENHILKAIQSGLDQQGYTVSGHATAISALEELSVHAVDFIICDLRMPEMDGFDFYQLLILRHPEMSGRVLFITGDSISRQTRDFLDRTHLPYLDKPFSLSELLERIRLASNPAY